MIYTVTFNPAVDYTVRADTVRLGAVNRSSGETVSFGGKGINVSAVLNELGVKSRALGFTAGFTGEALEKSLAEAGIETDFVRLDSGMTRINVKISSDTETELNGAGPDIPPEKLEEFFRRLDSVKDGDTIVLAGSVPPSLPRDIYEQILERLSDRRVKAVADAEKQLLLGVLKYKPFLVKPNNFELGDMFGTTLETTGQIIEYAGRLKEMGAENVLVSRAGDGAVLLDKNGDVHVCGVCKGTVRSSVGAGDSMTAGFIAGYGSGGAEYALKLGTAAGGATAFSDGLARKEDIFRLLKTLDLGDRG